PSRLPNLLVNGTVGIAVGMATNIPPHNLNEVIAATVALIDNPALEVLDLMKHIQGPDFPTGGIIHGKAGIAMAYKHGQGRAIVRSKTHMEDIAGRTAIVVDEIPYQVNKAAMIEHIADLHRDKIIEGIHDIRDESDRDGMRVVIELKKDAVPEIILNGLFKHSRMQVTCGIINLCLVNNVPQILPLKDLLQYFIDHRIDIVTKRTQFELRKAQERAHLLEGLKIAIEDIDTAIALIRKSPSATEAKVALMKKFPLDDVQTQAILDMKLQRLTALERGKIIEEHAGLMVQIADYQSILASRPKILNIIKSELLEVSEKYGDKRKTEIVESDVDVDMEDLIEDRNDVVTITHEGYIKRVSLDTYRSQRRGGKGIVATTTKDTDFVEKIFVAHTKSYLLFFTNKGQVHWLKVYNVPEGSRQSKGKAVVNLLTLEEGERVCAILPVREFTEGNFLVLATKNGTIKKSSLQDFSNPRAGGIRAIKLVENDELITAELTDGNQQIILATKDGIAIRFDEKDARELGRVSQGVRGIKLEENDSVVGMVIADDSKTLLTITEHGYGKRTPVSEYRLIGRGGKGVINIQTSERNGKVVSVLPVTDETGILLISRNGITIRTRANDISVIGRNTQGVRLMKLEETDRVVSCAVVANEDEPPENADDNAPITPPKSPEPIQVVSDFVTQTDEAPDKQ
ncbi:MAG TPA: DNA gyrase subunit A, partial [Acidobacteriota bacterium]|nr:DNA gyrase subunit A [Acidobacteriota bacterium]